MAEDENENQEVSYISDKKRRSTMMMIPQSKVFEAKSKSDVTVSDNATQDADASEQA